MCQIFSVSQELELGLGINRTSGNLVLINDLPIFIFYHFFNNLVVLQGPCFLALPACLNFWAWSFVPLFPIAGLHLPGRVPPTSRAPPSHPLRANCLLGLWPVGPCVPLLLPQLLARVKFLSAASAAPTLRVSLPRSYLCTPVPLSWPLPHVGNLARSS